MRNTITIDLTKQVATCCVCNEEHPIRRDLLRDQHALLELADELKHDHRECARDPQHPRMAKLSREFRKRVEREEQKAKRKSEIDRLTHTPFPLRRAA